MDPSQFWIDIGIVFNPIVSGVTIHMKSCCMDRLANAIQKIATDDNPVRSKASSFYFCLLSDAKGLTIVPGKTSVARQGGFTYLQCYCQIKNNLDAHKYYPFSDNERFSEILILNTEERDKLRGSRHLFDLFQCRISLLRNLLRVESGYGSSETSNRSRLEIRTSLVLYGEMLSQLEAENWPDINPLHLKDSDSKPYFVFETASLNRYVLNRIHTLARFFQEIVSIAEDLTLAQQKLARTVMRLLKCVVNSYPIERVGLLWKSVYRPKKLNASNTDNLAGEVDQDTDEDDDVLPEIELGDQRKGNSLLANEQLFLMHS